MKKTYYLLLAAFTLFLLAGCSSSDDGGNDGPGENTDSPYYQLIAGDWHLSAWSGEAPADFDIYVTFNADRSYMIYQKFEKPIWERYAGSYRFDNRTVSGVYSDGSAWGASYEIDIDASGNSFRMVSNTSVQEVMTFTRAAIPGDVKNAAQRKTSRAGGFRLF
ncbi:hypothetical protein [Alistipes sp.]|uniref:hypothetical protein n=1 Tax=Alistipes sp. TaxID=1872444 RepID=UPI003AEFDA70